MIYFKRTIGFGVMVFAVMLMSACGTSTTSAPQTSIATPPAVMTQVVVVPNTSPYLVIEPLVVPTPTAIASTAKSASGMTDPFAYCLAVGNVDAPDTQYTGPKVPDTLAKGLMKAMQMAADAPVEPFVRLTIWRCMNNKVYGCNFGANIPCQEKADTNKTPAPALNDYCKNNPNAPVIPAVVTGRATIYDWKCTAGKPAINKELTKPDARGFLTMFWYEISPQ